MKKYISVRLNEEDNKMLELYCKEEKIKKSEIVRLAIKKIIKKQKKGEKIEF